MQEKSQNSGQNAGFNSVDEILRRQEELREILRRDFQKETTILFTDICGYTQITETIGDIACRALLQKHNDILIPIIEGSDGIVVKTIGDALMARFHEPMEAIRAAISIQKALRDHNAKASRSERIHVKIGVNTGEVLLDEKDIFGDSVNVAARVQGKAGKNEILISELLYKIICGSDEVLCRYHDTVELKGKAEPMRLYKVVWEEEDLLLHEHPVRALNAVGTKRRASAPPMFHLEVTREGQQIKISAFEQAPGETSTVRHYEELSVSMEKIGERCREIVDTLNRANRMGRVSKDTLLKLRSIGQIFADDLFTLEVKNKLAQTRAEHLILHMDDQLVHIPWELLHDGQSFLCQRFSMGRLVKTRQTLPQGGKSRVLARPLRMLVLSDPKGDLKGAQGEGLQIIEAVDKNKDLITALHRSVGITPEYLREKIRNFDLIHFAGHADHNPDNPSQSGWRLSSGNFTAADIQKMAGTAAMPALIFSNACQSARTEEWTIHSNFQDEIFGLANAFVLSGVKHYLGTFWEILDEPSSRFAVELYKNIVSGMTVGEAVRQARLVLIREYGEETIVWGSYLLYGDPTSNYIEQIQALKADEAVPAEAAIPASEVRAESEVIDFDEPGKKKRRRSGFWAAAACLLLLITAVWLWGYPGILREGTEKYEQAAIEAYNGGNFNEALRLSEMLQKKDPGLRSVHLIRGDIALRSGDLEAAAEAYQAAVSADRGTDAQKAKALIGLGRIASLRKQTDQALSFYQKASEIAPQDQAGFISQALVLESAGKYQDALKLVDRAQQIAPGDRSLSAMAGDIRKKMEHASDREKQDRVTLLVKDLLERVKEPPRTLPWDGWSSKPLTLWIMDFQTAGYSLQEGDDRLLCSGLTGKLLEWGRTQVVERALLDKLMEELKLGASKLTDQRTALSLGNILAARLILSGKIAYSPAETGVTLRLIETETGRISAAIFESFPAAAPASLLTEKLIGAIIEKIRKQYPLRGKITRIEPDGAALNIGSLAGVTSGQSFKVPDQEVILETVAVQPEECLVKILKGKKLLQGEMRVEEMATPGS